VLELYVASGAIKERNERYGEQRLARVKSVRGNLYDNWPRRISNQREFFLSARKGANHHRAPLPQPARCYSPPPPLPAARRIFLPRAYSSVDDPRCRTLSVSLRRNCRSHLHLPPPPSPFPPPPPPPPPLLLRFEIEFDRTRDIFTEDRLAARDEGKSRLPLRPGIALALAPSPVINLIATPGGPVPGVKKIRDT